MPDMTIGQAFAWLAEQEPDAAAVHFMGEVLTRAELEAASNRIARAWLAHEMGHEDVVAVAMPNGIDFVLACVAAWKIGASVMPLSPRLSAAEREGLLALADPVLLVDAPGGRADGWDDTALPAVAATSWKLTASGVKVPRVTRSADPARLDPAKPVAPFVPQRAVQLVSGPLHEGAPFVYAMRGLMTGHELVVMHEFDAALWLHLVERHRVTWGLVDEAIMRQVAAEPGRTQADVSSLEAVLQLGARCPDDLRRAWADWLHPARLDEPNVDVESQDIALFDQTS